MDTGFSPSTLWWVLAGVLVIAELTSGTFFLLMLALGAVAGALAALLGLSLSGQLLAAAATGGLAVAGWIQVRSRRPRPPAAQDANMNLDLGSRVDVPAWSPQGLSEVQYRGARWQARHAGPGTPQPGWHVIVAIEGNRLVLKAAQP
ncbi:NfeD family protein [Piscinibacter sp. Jin2]|uniref:NfeD family protein n=1 Tax=Aquariibacter lacus TaxID=2801332 RepID=A0A9X0XEY6_9BURK|nr:NfeD family protein [Piscinibacter lacus]MBL0720321.1 NfeD family protein [Piscinibacter lacus]